MSVYLSDTNPNETCGGGGCVVCGSTKNPDQRGPFAVVVNDNEMASNVSPNVVVCLTCIEELERAFQSEELSAGESAPEPVEILPTADKHVVDEEEVPSL